MGIKRLQELLAVAIGSRMERKLKHETELKCGCLKRIMKLDPDVRLITAEAVPVVAKATVSTPQAHRVCRLTSHAGGISERLGTQGSFTDSFRKTRHNDSS